MTRNDEAAQLGSWPIGDCEASKRRHKKRKEKHDKWFYGKRFFKTKKPGFPTTKGKGGIGDDPLAPRKAR